MGQGQCCREQRGCLGISCSVPPLLCTDNGQGAAPACGPSPRDGPSSPGERGVQGTHASPCSQDSLPAAHCSLPLQMHNGSSCLCPVRPGPPGPPGPKVQWSSSGRGTLRDLLGELLQLSWPCKTFSAKDLDFRFGVWARGQLRCPLAGGVAGPYRGHCQREALGARSQALSFPDRERKVTEGPRETEASPGSLGREASPAAQGSQVTRVPGAPRVLRDHQGPRDHQALGEPGAHPCPPPSLRDQRTR